MENTAYRAIAIVGVGAVLPDAANAGTFWSNTKKGRYSITDVTPDRWDSAMYYDPDHGAPDKTYSKIGGWVREFPWEPMKWRMGIPPKVADAMDDGQKWAIACTREALGDFGYPDRPLDLDRTAVILGNAMGGERHYLTSFRIFFPEFARDLEASDTFATLPPAMRRDITRELHRRIGARLPVVTEDTMPGELSNCIAGRVANVFNMHGPNYICDAACASAMAAISSAVEGLVEHDFDVAITGGIDRNMGVSSFVKFCKIGALSATGSRPYAEGADGFVMGEGAAIFLLKRLADAERDGDRIHAVLRGMGGSSDGKGKGITAPNPAGQIRAIERAWQNAGLSPATATLFEGHGTSTRVGDVVEAQSLIEVLSREALPARSIALGSVKSNLGHLKAGAGAAGFLKLTLALRDKVLPPSLNFEHPSPDIDFAHSPLYVNTELKAWTVPSDTVRRGGLSAFGFGGTNFHAVLEEYVPHRLTGNGNGKHSIAVGSPAGNGHAEVIEKVPTSSGAAPSASKDSDPASLGRKAPLRGALVIGGASESELAERLRSVQKDAEAGRAPAPAAPAQSDLSALERIAIDYADAADLKEKCAKALKALASNQPAVWKALRSQGIFRGRGPRPKVAFLYTGQGSQYANMLRGLRDAEPIVARTFLEADRIMAPLLGKPLSEFVFVDQTDPKAVAAAEEDLRQTAITQPTVLAIDLALTRLLAAYGIRPDMTMGHSLGEYGALVASGSLGFEDALLAVSARGRGMTQVSMSDNGRMAAVFAPIGEIERLVKTVDGYLVIANINSKSQGVIGGASEAVEQAIAVFLKAGYNAVPLPVSHAFHTSIVAAAGEPLRQALSRMHLESPRIPIVTNVTGEFYPQGPDVVPQMLDLLGQQVASPVQFVKGLQTLYDAGARAFVEVGPKKALQGFAEDVLGDRPDVVALFTNHPKLGDVAAFNQALCGLYAAGFGDGQAAEATVVASAVNLKKDAPPRIPDPVMRPGDGSYEALGQMFADVLERGWQVYRGGGAPRVDAPVAITGAALGLPGTDRIFDDDNIGRILRGEQFIDVIPARLRRAMLDKNITRLMKTENGGPTFDRISDVADVIKLAGRGGSFDLEREFGVSAERLAALDRFTQLAIASGLDALRDAGIPLVMRYKTTSKGTQLPDRWGLPEAMRDDTGVIFASVWPGADSFAHELTKYHQDRTRREQLSMLDSLRERVTTANGNSALVQEIDRRRDDLRAAIEKDPYVFDRRFLFRILSMGHSQFAEFIGARGPNTQVNAACASTTQAVALAEDWIHLGRCRRVVIVSADDITTDNLLEWMGAGFLASGAAATDEKVEDAAVPFDRRRHGMIIGMGAASMVVESEEAARERGIRPICNVLGAVTANSAFHGTRLNVEHIGQVMEGLVAGAEARSGLSRHELASKMVFVSHETYTHARGGSASAEIHALRHVFGDDADRIVIANTKSLTGHAMGAGIEDVVAVKVLETGCVPPVVNFKEVDPELGELNLSKGGFYPVEYALRLAAGFGSQICMTLLRTAAGSGAARPGPHALGYAYRIVDAAAWSSWLRAMTGYSAPDLEVVHRTLRVRDQGAAACQVEAAQKEQPAAPPKAVQAARKIEVPVVAPRVAEPAPESSRPPAPSPEPAPLPELKIDPVQERILSLVAGITGYPVDMLALDLDLEADLGVDTVKQAEVFSAVRESYGIERDDKLRLRDFPTLAHVIGFVHDRRPDLAAAKPDSGVSKPEPAAVAPAPAEAKPASDPVKERILSLVAGITGYPVDMLALDLDLEADLGVDTVKQAEVFSAVRESYGIERDDKLRLRDFPTLAHVIGFVHDRRPDLIVRTPAPADPGPAPASIVTAPTVANPAGDPVKERILALVVEKTGYPPDMLDLDLDLEADLGVDTVKQAELFAAVRESYGIAREDTLRLRDFPTLAHVIGFVHDRRPDLAMTIPAPSAPAVREPESAVVATVRAPAKAASDPVKERVLALVVEKTGYPPDMLDLDLDLEADLGVDTVKQAELFAAIRESYDIPRDADIKLRDFPTLAHVIRFVHDRRPDLAGAQVAKAEPAAEPVTVTGAPQASAAAMDPIQEKVLEIVAEKTGYPREMLDLELDLEADLGIDTVKQAEMFSSVRAAFNIPRDENLKLRDFPTLERVIQFARDGQPAADAVPPAIEAPVQHAPASLDAANLVPRRVPVPVLRAPLSLCKPTGVTLGQGSRAVIMPDEGGVAAALAQRLTGLGVEVLCVENPRDAGALSRELEGWLAAGPIQGVFWLPALDDEGDMAAMDLPAWQNALRLRVKSLYATMRTLYEQVAAQNSFLVAATRLGGQHGYDDAGATMPLGGAVTGFVKTYKRERIEALSKAVDFEPGRDAGEIAAALIEETLFDPGAVEIGRRRGERWGVGLQELSPSDGQPGQMLDKDTVFVITGAAGSIVSAIVGDLAAASGGTFYLLDLAPEPDPNNPDLGRFANDKDGLKRDLFARIKARGKRATPAMVDKELAALERAHAALSAIDAVRSAGGTAHYFSVNLADAKAVASAIAQVREQSGRIDVLLHAAGLERSHFLPDKDPKEFDLVFDVKADGWFNLLSAIRDMPLGATVAFSSVAGRFGNAGQSDYSAANDLLCKIASSFRTTRPATRGIVIDWTAWGGIGMATRGSIPKMMELAGIDMLPPEAGIPWIRRELVSGGTRGEVLVAQRLGILLNEFDAAGGIDPSAAERLPASRPMIGRIESMSLQGGVTIETTLDPAMQPFLHDHRIEGTPVLPGVMGIEAFAEAALTMLPGWHVEAIEDVKFLAPFKFYRDEPRTLIIHATLRPQGEAIVADCRLEGRRQLPNQPESQVTTHFTGRVRLAREAPQHASCPAPPPSNGSFVESSDIYKIYFHGPAYQVLDRAWADDSWTVGQMALDLPVHHQPAERLTTLEPRLIELCFQTAGLSEIASQNRMGLPLQVERVRLFGAPDSPGERIYAMVDNDPNAQCFDVHVVDSAGNLYMDLSGYRTVALPNAVDSEPLNALHAVAVESK